MKKIAIYCVTYNSYKETSAFLASVNVAAENAPGMEVSVIVADNTVEDVEDISTQYSQMSVRVVRTHNNCGYLGAVQMGMKVCQPTDYDYIAISNVDLTMAPDALLKLGEAEIPENTGWIAPQIYSTLEKRDRNPAVMGRYTKKKLEVLLFLYRHPWLNTIYESTFYKRKKLNISQHRKGEEIYAGHGSFMVFTHDFIHKAGIPQYPMFLFGEEIYLAELCRQASLKVVYLPEVKVIDAEHCSVSKIRRKTYYQYNADSIKYLIERFYE